VVVEGALSRAEAQVGTLQVPAYKGPSRNKVSCFVGL
jgi:hypothetical protein